MVTVIRHHESLIPPAALGPSKSVPTLIYLESKDPLSHHYNICSQARANLVAGRRCHLHCHHANSVIDAVLEYRHLVQGTNSKKLATRLFQPWPPCTRFQWPHWRHQHHLLHLPPPNPTRKKVATTLPKKSEVNHVRQNVGCNRLDYPGEVSYRFSSTHTTKCLIKSTI